MFEWFSDLFTDIFIDFIQTINNVLNTVLLSVGVDLSSYDFNLTLFSDTPIISMSVDKLISTIIVVLLLIFAVKLLYSWVRKFFELMGGIIKL